MPRQAKTPTALRARKCWSVARLARAADLDRLTVEAIEAGKPGVRATSIEAVAAALGLSAERLFAAYQQVRRGGEAT